MRLSGIHWFDADTALMFALENDAGYEMIDALLESVPESLLDAMIS